MEYKGVDIKKGLPTLHTYSFDLIAGLPRSGMNPAYMSALYLNINCTDLNSFINNTPLKIGGTRKSRYKSMNPLTLFIL
jgi:hypothetical protein